MYVLTHWNTKWLKISQGCPIALMAIGKVAGNELNCTRQWRNLCGAPLFLTIFHLPHQWQALLSLGHSASRLGAWICQSNTTAWFHSQEVGKDQMDYLCKFYLRISTDYHCLSILGIFGEANVYYTLSRHQSDLLQARGPAELKHWSFPLAQTSHPN